MSDLSMAEPLASDDGCMAGSKDVSRLYERIADVRAHWDFTGISTPDQETTATVPHG